eukprot:1157512-Pelagomonas_calceolata.AAC.9
MTHTLQTSSANTQERSSNTQLARPPSAMGLACGTPGRARAPLGACLLRTGHGPAPQQPPCAHELTVGTRAERRWVRSRLCDLTVGSSRGMATFH